MRLPRVGCVPQGRSAHRSGCLCGRALSLSPPPHTHSIGALPAPLGRFIIIAFCILLVSPCCYFYCK
jgi:hypothetical protein